MKDDAPFGYVAVFRAHANVGFFQGAEPEDPTGLLEGSGKQMRHVKAKPGVELESAAPEALIAIAYADMKVRLALEDANGSASSIRERKGRRRPTTRRG